jgi:hypothetical protein
MRVSVVIPCRNSTKFLESGLRSALAQRLTPMEILCVDDASGLEAHERLLRLQREAPDRIRVIRLEEQAGVSRARNTGIKEARGEWIAFLDDDDLWLPEKLAMQAQLAAADPAAEVLHAFALTQEGHDTSTQELYAAGKFLSDRDPFPFIFHSNYLNTSTVVIRRDVLQAVGGFDAGFRRGEDFDLWLRLAEAGRRFAHVAKPLVLSRRHRESLSSDRAGMLREVFEVRALNFERDRDGRRRLAFSEGMLTLMDTGLRAMALHAREGGPGAPAAWEGMNQRVRGLYQSGGQRSWGETIGERWPLLKHPAQGLARLAGDHDAMRHAIRCGEWLGQAMSDWKRLDAAIGDGQPDWEEIGRMAKCARAHTKRSAKRVLAHHALRTGAQRLAAVHDPIPVPLDRDEAETL